MNCEINEIWKPVQDFEDRYEISNKGLLHCLKTRYTKEHYTYGNKGGKYLTFVLCKNKYNHIQRPIHKLVYETFVGPIPKGYDVHHINHNRQDNRLENLCLIEKSKHSKMHLTERNVENKSKPILQYTLDGEFVAEYPSTREAERQTGIKQTNISNCCIGAIRKGYKCKSAGGFIWKYKEVA